MALTLALGAVGVRTFENGLASGRLSGPRSSRSGATRGPRLATAGSFEAVVVAQPPCSRMHFGALAERLLLVAVAALLLASPFAPSFLDVAPRCSQTVRHGGGGTDGEEEEEQAAASG